MSRYLSLLFLALLLAAGVDARAIPQDEPPPDDNFEPAPASFYEGLEFDMPKVGEPTFPDYSVSSTDFRAVGDGKH